MDRTNMEPNLASLNYTSAREPTFELFVEQVLEPFWQEFAVPGEFTNGQGLAIRYVTVEPEVSKQTILVSPGRVEGYLKYKELVFDLVQQGYRVVIVDHQGQGLSSRKLSNPHKGFVSSFEDYVDDLRELVTEVILPQTSTAPILLAHSMGCAIGLRYLQRFPEDFEKAIFCSPMWGFLSGGVPKPIAKGIVDAGLWVSEKLQGESAYFFGNQDYQNKPFANNQLTSSEARYRYFRALYEQTPQLKLGGITFAWVVRAVELLDTALAEIDKVKAQVMVLQAGNERIIDNKAQDSFCAALSEAQGKRVAPIVFADGQHELLIENDKIRTQVLDTIFGFID